MQNNILRGEIIMASKIILMGCQVYLFISQPTPLAEHVGIVARVTHKFALEKGDVKTRGIVVDKLEEEHLHC